MGVCSLIKWFAIQMPGNMVFSDHYLVNGPVFMSRMIPDYLEVDKITMSRYPKLDKAVCDFNHVMKLVQW